MTNMAQLAVVSDGRCFLSAWDVSTSVIALKHDRLKPYLPKWKDIHPFSKGLLISKCPFQDRAMPGKN